MASRQGGVHVSYLIVAIMVCLGLIVVVVLQNGELEERNTQIASEKSAALAKENKLAPISMASAIGASIDFVKTHWRRIATSTRHSARQRSLPTTAKFGQDL